ncbi:MAG: amino acid ABC transporter substrate-binding protein [Candidatus Methylomirabilales bacterium]
MRQQAIGMRGSLILITLGILAFPMGKVGAETVLEKISRTRKFTAGTRTSSIPFAYVNKKKEWVGFSVDLIKEIHQRLERELRKKITLELKEVTPETRIFLVANRTIDIECGSTTFTQSRDEVVDFSINFFYTGSRLLVKKRSFIMTLDDLAGKRVGVTRGTTNEAIIREKQPQAKLLLFKDHPEGFRALQQDTIDAYSTDGILLAGLVTKAPNPDEYAVVDFFSSEPYACMLPENDSKWRDFVNHTFMRLIESGKYFELYDKWFGKQGVVPYPMPTWVEVFIGLQRMPR